MANNEFIDGLRSQFDEGDNDPYIRPIAATTAIEQDYPQWQFAIDSGLADSESAALMAAFGVENPYDVSEVSLAHENENWTLTIIDGGATIEINLNDDSLPFWVWDWFYDMADDFGWDWEITYE